MYATHRCRYGRRTPAESRILNDLHCTHYKYNKTEGYGGITMQGYTDIIMDEARARGGYCAWASWTTNSCASSRLIARIVLTF